MSLLFIAPLVGLAWRAGDWKHFWVMAGIFALVWILGAFALYNLIESSSLQKLVGFSALALAAAGLLAVGSFLWTGKYESSLRYVSWVWPWKSASQVEQPTAQQPSPAPVEPAPTVATPAARVAPAAGAGDWAWLLDTRLSDDRVLAGLNQVWAATSEEASSIADVLQQADLATLPDVNRQAIGLLAGVALERAGRIQEAHVLYKQVADRNPQDPYAASASARLHFVKPTTVKPGKEPNIWTKWQDDYNAKSVKAKAFVNMQHASILHEPERWGWFLLSDQWVWDTSLRSTIRVLSEAGSGQVSFEAFRLLRTLSPLEPQHSFMFAFLVLAIGIKFLELPLYVRNARLAEYTRWDALRVWRSMNIDPQSKRTMLINVYAITIVELIFVMWILNAVQQSAVQWAVDGARFLWVDDVTQRDFWVLAIWLLLYSTSWLITGEERVRLQVQFGVPGLTCAQVTSNLRWYVGFGVVWVITAWTTNWPSALFILWSGLLLAGILLTLVLRLTWRTAIHLKNR